MAATYPYLSGHQLNFATGNKYLRETDYRATGPGLAFDITREYNSQSKLSSPFGSGWSINLYDKIEIASKRIVHINSGGRHTLFNKLEDHWQSMIGRKKVITFKDGLYKLTYADGRVQIFNSDGLLVSMADRNGNSRTYTYNAGLLSTVTDNIGRTITCSYDNGHISSLQTPQGTYSYSYDSNNNLIAVTKPDGTQRRYLYTDTNDIHNLTGVIDETGLQILTVSYDDKDRVIGSEKAGGLDAVQIDYSGGPTLRRITDSLGRISEYTLTLEHGIAVIKSATGSGCSSCGSTGSVSYTYNDRLQPTSITDAKGVITNYSYDDAGNRTEKTEAAGTADQRITSWEYDPTTNLRSKKIKPSAAGDGSTVETAYSYDTNGNLLAIAVTATAAGGDSLTQTTSYSYDSLGRITAIDGPRDDVSDKVLFSYYADDAAQGANRGQLHTVTNALGHITTYGEYNDFGQAGIYTDANGLKTRTEYNARGQLISRTTGTLTTSYNYDDAGRLTSITSPGGRTVIYRYNDMGLLSELADTYGNTIKYSYDSQGQRTRQEIFDTGNTLKNYTDFAYDGAGRLQKVINPDGGNSERQYDQVGNLVAAINELGQKTEYTFDSLNRLTTILLPDGAKNSISYNNADQQQSVTDGEGHKTSFTSDGFANRIGQVSPETGTTAYTYDAAGNQLSITRASGTVLGYKYDALNRPVAITVDGTPLRTISYDTAANGIGRLARITDSSGTTDYSYTPMGQLESESRNFGAFTLTTRYGYNTATGELDSITCPGGLELKYIYDDGGNITGLQADGVTIMENRKTLPFGPTVSYDFAKGLKSVRNYDQRYQLKSIHTADLNTSYSRDLLGRVTAIDGLLLPDIDNITKDYSYTTGSSRLAEIKTKDKKQTYTLDSNGNTIADGNFNYTYDGLNRLIEVKKDGTIIAAYSYDAYNRRVSKKTGDTTTFYLYDPNGNLLSEVDSSGNVLRDYIYLDNTPFAVKVYGGKSPAGIYYFLNDHLGTPQQLVDSNGVIVWQAAYYPFGKAQVVTETVTNPLRFPGQYYDTETGLHYNWNRYYDPETGRYISADPIGLDGGINLYVYVENDPVDLVDRDGLSSIDCIRCPYYMTKCANSGIKCNKKLCEERKDDIVPPTPTDLFNECYRNNPDCQKKLEICGKCAAWPLPNKTPTPKRKPIPKIPKRKPVPKIK